MYLIYNSTCLWPDQFFFCVVPDLSGKREKCGKTLVSWGQNAFSVFLYGHLIFIQIITHAPKVQNKNVNGNCPGPFCSTKKWKKQSGHTRLGRYTVVADNEIVALFKLLVALH